MLSSLLSLLVLLSIGISHGQDEPDLAKEAKFHEIYLNYNQSPTPEEQWQQAVTTAQAQTYDIQTGDTLWDLSNTLFADPNFWPKIWSLNTEGILNPHQILPGQSIQFIPGTMSEAPSLALAQPGEGGEQVAIDESGTSVTQPTTVATLDNYEIPPPKRQYVPYSPLPQSVPYWTYNLEGDQKKQVVNFEVEPISRSFPSLTTVAYYLSNEEVVGLGEVKGTETDMKSAATFQHVYVNLENDPGADRNFLVVRNHSQIKDPFEGGRATMVEVQGEIEVLELVNSEENTYRAIVKDQVNPVTVGSVLIKGKIQTVSLDPGTEGPQISARIIGGQFENDRKLFGPDAVVFINVGSSQGVQVGQSLPIYKILPARFENSVATQNASKIGQMKVISSTDSFATAIITEISDDARIGDATTANPN